MDFTDKHLIDAINEIVDRRIKEHDNVVNRKIIRANYKAAKRLAETGDANLVAEEHKKLLGIYLDEIHESEE